MNDWEGMEAVNAVLEEYFRGQSPADNALAQIAQISGANKIEHQEARP